jgi:hypothetical protein
MSCLIDSSLLFGVSKLWTLSNVLAMNCLNGSSLLGHEQSLYLIDSLCYASGII